MIKFFISL